MFRLWTLAEGKTTQIKHFLKSNFPAAQIWQILGWYITNEDWDVDRAST
jgi:hypothetical protein